METIVSKLTVLFEGPFWIGLYERRESGQLTVCKITFGAEPKDGEVYAMLLSQWNQLRFSPPLKIEAALPKHLSPKRMQRLIHSETKSAGIGTKAQQALKLQQEQGKLTHKCHSREQREKEKERQFAKRREKHKEKHRGH